jgi:S-sulfo-L-cysteine synthase (O-acetyl-L-serine-dependent)
MGTGKRLREYNPNIKVISIEPAEPLHGLEGLKHMATSIVPGIFDPIFPDERLYVPTEDSYRVMKELLKTEGIFVGHSGGAVIYATLEYAKKLNEGVLVTILPDSGYRYLSGGIWW